MSASSEIRFKFGSDHSALSRGFAKAESIAAAAGKSISRKLGMKDAFKSSVLALGLSIEKISEQIAEMWTGGSQESWKTALDSANEAARIIEDSTLRRMSTVRQIAELEDQIRRNAANEIAEPKKGGEPNFLRKSLDAIGEKMFSGAASLFEKLGAGPQTVGSLRRTQEIFRSRGAGEDIEESEAEVQARVAKANADRLAKEAKIEELKEKSERDAARVAAARLDLARLTMTEMEKALSIQEELVASEEKLVEAKRKGKETTELEIEVLRKKKALEEQLLKIEKDQTEEDKKQKRAREVFIEKYKRFLGAQERVGDAQKNLTDARRDSLALGVEETAAGARGTASDRLKARRILQLEERARKLFASGASVTEFDSRTQRNVQVDAQTLQNRALQMRKDFGKLKTDEQNPFKAAEEQLKEANKHLAEIQKSLTETDVE
jgi:hypothetical protein